MALALLLLDQGEISEAIDVVESLPVNSNETQSFSDLFYILVYAAQNELSISELPQTKVDELEEIAANRNIGGYAAQVILSQYYNREYLSIIETDTSLEYRVQKNKKLEYKLPVSMVKIHPNPVDAQLSIIYQLSKSAPWTFNILSLDGKLWSQTRTGQNSGKLNINTTELPPGVYILCLNDGIMINEFRKFIKK